MAINRRAPEPLRLTKRQSKQTHKLIQQNAKDDNSALPDFLVVVRDSDS